MGLRSGGILSERRSGSTALRRQPVLGRHRSPFLVVAGRDALAHCGQVVVKVRDQPPGFQLSGQVINAAGFAEVVGRLGPGRWPASSPQ